MDYKDRWVDPGEWVSRYGEITSKSNAARLIGKSPAYITGLLHDGVLVEYRSGISVRQLAEIQFQRRIATVRDHKRN